MMICVCFVLRLDVDVDATACMGPHHTPIMQAPKGGLGRLRPPTFLIFIVLLPTFRYLYLS